MGVEFCQRRAFGENVSLVQNLAPTSHSFERSFMSLLTKAAIATVVAIVFFGGVLPAHAITDNPGPGLTPTMAISATLTVAAPTGSAASQFMVSFNTPAGAGDPLTMGPWATPRFAPIQTQCPNPCSGVTLDIVRGGVATSYPLSWVSNSGGKAYLLQLEGNRTTDFVGALVGDVVRINFAAGAFELPDPSTGLVPFVRFDHIIPSTGVNGVIAGASSTATFGTPPAAPAAPSAVAGDAEATVTIASGTSPEGVTGYRLTANPGGNYCDVTLPATNCVVSGLQNGTSYTFTSAATNAIGLSDASSASSAVTPNGSGTGGQGSTGELAATGFDLLTSVAPALAAIFLGLVVVALRRKKSLNGGESAEHRP